jgi:galactose mutarotase-like enzyme
MGRNGASEPIFTAKTTSRSILTLFDGVAEAVVVPELGAGLASYDLIEADTRIPLFRPRRDLRGAGPFDLANNLLLPWSNRISGGGFRFGTATVSRPHGPSNPRSRPVPSCRSRRTGLDRSTIGRARLTDCRRAR